MSDTAEPAGPMRADGQGAIITGALSGLVVLDLADRALLAGRILAQLGASVTLIEPPGGSPARRTRGAAHWAAYGTSRASLTTDLESPAGREAVRALAATADILLESEEPGRLAKLGLGYDDLSAINPRLIYVSITPFGSSGPRADWQESDITLWASGGPLHPSRDGNRPPLRISSPQAWLHAAADAAGGALIAHHWRERSGLGQHVDVSVQQSVTQATLGAMLADAVGHHGFTFGVPGSKSSPPPKKTLDLSGSGARTRRSKWQAANGLIEMHLGIGPASGAKTNNFFAWMREEGVLPETMHDWDWITLPAAISEGRIGEAELEAARTVTAAFLATKRKEEIVREAMRRKILMAPIHTVEDLVRSPHHRTRGYFQTVGPDGTTLPGSFALGIGFAPLKPAPEVGPAAPTPSPAPSPCPYPQASPAPALPFAGLKVLDLAWVVAGPAIGRVLADYGATVVRVESSRRVDTARVMGPFPGGAFDVNRSSNYETFNAGKLGLALDLAQDPAREVARDLVAWADVVIESFAPGQMERWGLGYDTLRAIKPDIVMLSTSLMGQTGPYAAFAGFGNIGAAMSGFQEIVGWPGALPIGPFGPYTDYVGPRFGLVTLLAALHQRRETGEGAWLDISQAEAGMQFLAAEIAAFSTAGTIARANGNRDPHMAPHGVFPCAGEDRWVAIAVRSDDEWAALATLIGGTAEETRWATLSGRQQNEDALDALMADWTSTMAPEILEAKLQSLGIPAYIAGTSADMVRDPQLIHRGQFVSLAHECGGESVVEASRYQLSLTPARYGLTAPSFGRDNLHVLRDLLNYDEDHIAALDAAGVFV